jgi:LPS O-antigen subunit length determinant protein (WzzB/FepE family)
MVAQDVREITVRRALWVAFFVLFGALVAFFLAVVLFEILYALGVFF